MRKEIELQYNPRVGAWIKPGALGETNFAATSPATLDETRKKYLLAAAVLTFVLGVAVWWKRRIR